MKKISVIGSGFAGLSAACYLSKNGYDVTVFEKNSQAGGRARTINEAGFLFDMGPSWYWMPDVFEDFFNDFGKTTSDFYELKRLDPSYKIFWGKNDVWNIPSDYSELCALFESVEKGSSEKLNRFLKEAEFKYNNGMKDLVNKPSLSATEFMKWGIIKNTFRIDLFKSFSKHVRNYFTNPKLIQLLEFPVLFLGALPQNTPALYSLMNYADIKLGTWYPMGGMHKIIEAMTKIAVSNGVKINLNSNVTKIIMNGSANSKGIQVNDRLEESSAIVAAADYQYVDQTLVPDKFKTYTSEYWNKRTLAPSCLIYYVGVNKKIKNLEHHNLFFDKDFKKHSDEIYTTLKWPTAPLFYVSCPSKTDPSVAPENNENLFILIPVSTGLNDTPEIRQTYFEMVLGRLEELTGETIKPHIVFKRSYAHSDFISDYNSFKGNAYGLANTLMQTAFLKPKAKSTKIHNLFYAGQLTVPGPGVPPSIISGKIASELLTNKIN